MPPAPIIPDGLGLHNPSRAFAEATGEEPEDVADELLAVVDGLTVDALTDPERYPPDRQLALLRRALRRLGLPTDLPSPGAF